MSSIKLPATPLSAEAFTRLLQQEETLCHWLLHVGRQAALKLGLSAEEASECALAFVGDMLPWCRHIAPNKPLQSGAAYVIRAAFHFAARYARERHNRTRHEILTSEWEQDADEPPDWEGECLAASPELLAFWNLFRTEVESAIECLPAATRACMRAHLLEEQTVGEIVSATGKPPKAVYALLSRSCLRLRQTCEQCGWQEDSLRALVASSSHGGGS
jgi:DNA-directed RNA polymerase specialized sigma24 family protein